MEAIGLGLEAIGGAIGAVAGWAGFVCVVGIAALTFLVYTDKVPFEKIEQFLNKRKRY